ncbi:MAG: hypothetical protein KJ069_17815 [Anaerolineae bacterium]|nr:hypothetical protein [Anaerolineae bacterium]
MSMIEDEPAVPPPTEILCNQCTAVLPVEQGALTAVCEFCGATNVVDKSQAVLHYVVRDTLRDTDAAAALRRWMGGNETVKNLDSKATIKSPTFQLWPLWLVRADVEGAEKVFIKPAAPVSVLDTTRITIPASDLEPYQGNAYALEPTVPLNAVKKWLAADQQISDSMIKEMALVHLPVYVFEYQFQGRPYTAVVEAAAGRVFADIFPSKQEVPYQTVAGVGCLLYFCAALIPAAGFLTGNLVGLGGGILIYLIAALVMAVPMFAIASYVSHKI